MADQDVNVILKARDEATAKINKIGSTVKGLAIGIAGYFSARAISGFVTSSVQGFIVQEQVVRGLSDALQSIGESSVTSALEAYASQMQSLTTYGDEAILSAMQLGVSMAGLSGRDLEAATTAAMGLSKAYKMDLDAAMKLVAKAATGNTGAMSKMGITFKDGLSAAEKYAEVIQRGGEGFRIAQGETETFGGILKQLSNSWGDAKEKLGQYIAENETLKTYIQWLQVGMENFGTVMQLVWTNAALGMVQFWEDLKHRFTSEIPTAIDWFADHWKEIFTDLFQGTKAIFVNLGKNIYDFFAAVVSWMKGDGFNFEWTGLTEGFKSSISAMPEFTERTLSEVEKILMAEAEGYAGVLLDAMDKKKNPSFSAADAVAGAAMGRTSIEEAKQKSSAAASGWSLRETRTGGGYRSESPEAKKMDRMIELLAKIAEKSEDRQPYARTGGRLELTVGRIG